MNARTNADGVPDVGGEGVGCRVGTLDDLGSANRRITTLENCLVELREAVLVADRVLISTMNR